MLEMKPDGGIETGPPGPSPDPGPKISFEMPAHEMCLERRAVLSRLDGQSEYMTFAIDFMPDVIWIDGRKFKYGGVSDGRGFYREIENPVFAEIARSHVDYFKNAAIPIGDENPESELPLLSLQLAKSIDAISVCLHGVPHRYPCEDCDREDLERAGDLDSMHETAENATPNPRMQCPRCSELLDLVSQMIENPPGLSGIHCHLGHVGNHYVDAGWVEALTRVKTYLVTGGSGTREEI